MRLHRRLLGPMVTLTAIAALLLLVVLGNTNVAILAAAAAVLLGMVLVRRYGRDWPVDDNDSTPGVEFSAPAVARTQVADDGTIADLANRTRGRS
jgi:hypothetical protein